MLKKLYRFIRKIDEEGKYPEEAEGIKDFHEKMREREK